jgi:hypothetical protein
VVLILKGLGADGTTVCLSAPRKRNFTEAPLANTKFAVSNTKTKHSSLTDNNDNSNNCEGFGHLCVTSLENKC